MALEGLSEILFDGVCGNGLPKREHVMQEIMGEFYHEALLFFFKEIAANDSDVKIMMERKGNSLAKAYEPFFEKLKNPEHTYFQNSALPFRAGAGELRGKTVLIIDDISIAGRTLFSVIRELIDIYGVDDANIKIAVFAINEKIVSKMNSHDGDTDQNSIENRWDYLCDKLANDPLELDEYQLLRLSSQTAGLIHATSTPYVSYTPSFYLSGLDLLNGNTVRLIKWDVYNATKDYQSKIGINAWYFKYIRKDHEPFAAVRLYCNRRLDINLLIPIVFLPPMLNSSIGQLFDKVIILLGMHEVGQYINTLNERIKSVAQYRWLHYVFCHCVLRKFASECPDVNLIEKLKHIPLDESFANDEDHPEFNTGYVLWSISDEVIECLWDMIPQHADYVKCTQETNIDSILRRTLFEMGGHDKSNSGMNIIQFMVQNKFKPSTFFWELQKVLDSGEATMRAKHTEDGQGVEPFAQAGEQAHQYLPLLDEPFSQIGCCITYMMSRLSCIMLDWEDKKSEVKRIIESYMNKKQITLHDPEGFDIAFSSGKHPICFLSSNEISKYEHANFFIGMTLHYPKYIKSNIESFDDYLRTLQETDYAIALREGLLDNADFSSARREDTAIL